jgi:hypothetical protein
MQINTLTYFRRPEKISVQTEVFKIKIKHQSKKFYLFHRLKNRCLLQNIFQEVHNTVYQYITLVPSFKKQNVNTKKPVSNI